MRVIHRATTLIQRLAKPRALCVAILLAACCAASICPDARPPAPTQEPSLAQRLPRSPWSDAIPLDLPPVEYDRSVQVAQLLTVAEDQLPTLEPVAAPTNQEPQAIAPAPPQAVANPTATEPAKSEDDAPENKAQENKAPENNANNDPSDDDALPIVDVQQLLNQRGDLTLRGDDATIENALFTISEIWSVNIVVGNEVRGAVTGVFKNAPLREILDSILLANGYSYRAVGDSLVVQPIEQIGSANPLFKSMTIPIVHAQLDELVEATQLLKSQRGQVRALKSARSLLVIDYAERTDSIARFIAQMERSAAANAAAPLAHSADRLEVGYFHAQFVPADHLKGPLLTVLSAQGRIEVMPKENRVVVVDYPANLAVARRVLERLDRPRPQVRITALIYDLSLQDIEKIGLNWGTAGKGRDLNADGVAKQQLEFATETLAPLTGAGGTLTIRSLTRYFDINSVLNLLQNANDARLLADPNVTVTDNEVAEWKSITEIPYQQITQSELGGQIGTTAFKEAGITLRVQPTIASDGTVEMLVEPEFSRLAGFTPGENQPIIDTRRASTTVRIANRQTLVIGGLRQRSDTGEFNGIPYLKDVRGIGPLFRSRDTNVRESELVVFISPEIVNYDACLSCRDGTAVDTIHCRLAAIPTSEGCLPEHQEELPYGCDQGAFDNLPPVQQTPETSVEADLPDGPQVLAPPSMSVPSETEDHHTFEGRYRTTERPTSTVAP